MGVNGYPFLVNNNGFILYHPDFRPLVSIPLRDLIKFQLIFCTFLSRIFPFLKKKKFFLFKFPLETNDERCLIGCSFYFIQKFSLRHARCGNISIENKCENDTHAQNRGKTFNYLLNSFIKQKKSWRKLRPQKTHLRWISVSVSFKKQKKIYFNYCRCLFILWFSLTHWPETKRNWIKFWNVSVCVCVSNVFTISQLSFQLFFFFNEPANTWFSCIHHNCRITPANFLNSTRRSAYWSVEASAA